jgi:alkylmercury lyase
VETRQEKKGRESNTIEEMAEAIRSAMPLLDPTEQRIAIATYRLLAEGVPVSSEAIAQATYNRVDRVDDALNSWPGVFRDDEGRVVVFWGLASGRIDPEYRFLIDGETSYAWCALDTLFIPRLLGQTVGVEATDPVTGERVSLVVDQNGVRDLKPSGAVVSMVIPDGPFGYDVIESFCHKVLFFASREAGTRWTAEHEGTTLLSVQEAFELGRGFEPVYPDIFVPRGEN